MNTDLYLHESILLLGLDDDKGNYTTSLSYLNYAFAAALIMDLILLERISIGDKHVKLKTNAITESKVLNKVLKRIQETKKSKKLSSWLHSLVQGNSKMTNQAIENLIKKNILKRKKEKIMWVFKVNRYPSVDLHPENLLRTRLREVIFNEVAAQPKDLMLLSITQACKMEKDLIPDKEERKFAKKKIKSLTEDSKILNLVGDTIKEMEILTTVITTVMV